MTSLQGTHALEDEKEVDWVTSLALGQFIEFLRKFKEKLQPLYLLGYQNVAILFRGPGLVFTGTAYCNLQNKIAA